MMQLNLFKKLPGLKEINDTRKKVLSQDNEKKFFSSVSKLTRGKINLGSVKRPIAEVLSEKPKENNKAVTLEGLSSAIADSLIPQIDLNQIKKDANNFFQENLNVSKSEVRAKLAEGIANTTKSNINNIFSPENEKDFFAFAKNLGLDLETDKELLQEGVLQEIRENVQEIIQGKIEEAINPALEFSDKLKKSTTSALEKRVDAAIDRIYDGLKAEKDAVFAVKDQVGSIIQKVANSSYERPDDIGLDVENLVHDLLDRTLTAPNILEEPVFNAFPELGDKAMKGKQNVHQFLKEKATKLVLSPEQIKARELAAKEKPKPLSIEEAFEQSEAELALETRDEINFDEKESLLNQFSHDKDIGEASFDNRKAKSARKEKYKRDLNLNGQKYRNKETTISDSLELPLIEESQIKTNPSQLVSPKMENIEKPESNLSKTSKEEYPEITDNDFLEFEEEFGSNYENNGYNTVAKAELTYAEQIAEEGDNNGSKNTNVSAKSNQLKTLPGKGGRGGKIILPAKPNVQFGGKLPHLEDPAEAINWTSEVDKYAQPAEEGGRPIDNSYKEPEYPNLINQDEAFEELEKYDAKKEMDLAQNTDRDIKLYEDTQDLSQEGNNIVDLNLPEENQIAKQSRLQRLALSKNLDRRFA